MTNPSALPFLKLPSLFLAAALGLAGLGVPAATFAEDEIPATSPRALSELERPQPGETAEKVLRQMAERLNNVQSVRAHVQFSERRKKIKYKSQSRRKITTGPVELVRGVGARAAVHDGKNVDEYIADTRMLWSIDHNKREAQYIPASTPIIGTYVEEAKKMNVFAAVDETSLRYSGTQDVHGEPCWVLRARTPKRLELVGAKQMSVTYWISKKDGLPRRMHIPAEDDLIILVENIRINVPIDKKRFSYKPPSKYKTKNVFGL